jgi:16S rRNA processing protein RimM
MTNQPKIERELPDFVVIGYVTKPHGVRGALRIEPITDDPQRFNQLAHIFLTLDEQSRHEFQINKVQIGPKFVIISLDEITDRNEAEKWKNAYVEIPRDKVVPLPEGQNYYFELIGALVQTKSGEKIGHLVDVLNYPANDVYVVKSELKEILIPVVPDIVVESDAENGTITIDPIEGLLD